MVFPLRPQPHAPAVLQSRPAAATLFPQHLQACLPRAVDLEDPRAYLEAYADTYVREEVQAEALTRNIGGFARFLEIAARQNGQSTNVSSIARDAAVARPTVQGFFDVLVDTLLGWWLPAWKHNPANKLVSHPKFYFFDAGVVRALARRLSYATSPEELGTQFETCLLHEIRAFLSYSGLGFPLHYYRTHDGAEVDLVVETRQGHLAIEFKSTRDWRTSHERGFDSLRRHLPELTCLGVYAGDRPLQTGRCRVLPYGEFLQGLWAGEWIR